jgi:hypothetical protein
MLSRCCTGYQQGATFFGQPLWWVPVPAPVVQVASVAVAVVLGVWVVRGFIRSDAGAPSLWSNPSLFVMSHVLVFALSYVVFTSVDGGWLVVNVWHNLQYILVVWLFNVNRVNRAQGDGAAVRRANLFVRQARIFPLYVLASIGLATAMYAGIDGVSSVLARYGIPAGMILYATVNFHHYVVDAVVWKVRKKSVRTALGLVHA